MEGGPEDLPLPAALRALPRRLGVGRTGRRGDAGGGAEDDPGTDQCDWGSLHLQVSASVHVRGRVGQRYFDWKYVRFC